MISSRQATGFEKKKTFGYLGLVAAQRNGIAAYTYSLKNILTVHMVRTQLYRTWSAVLRPFFFLLEKGPEITLFRLDC